MKFGTFMISFICTILFFTFRTDPPAFTFEIVYKMKAEEMSDQDELTKTRISRRALIAQRISGILMTYISTELT